MKLYVGNLPFSTSNEDLQDLFQPYGPIEDVYIAMDRETNRPRGFAFVTLSDDSLARNAIEALNDTEIGGRRMVINEARPKEDRGPRGGGFGGGGGGGRRSFGGGGGGGNRGGGRFDRGR